MAKKPCENSPDRERVKVTKVLRQLQSERATGKRAGDKKPKKNGK